jgi:predicted peptidase
MILLPEGYNQNDNKTYSMLMYLHYNSQEPGSVQNDVNAYFNNAEFRKNYPAIVVVPFYTNDRGNWGGTASSPTVTETATIAVAQRVISTYKVDPNRVYITGTSQGAIGAWSYIIDYNRQNGNPKIFQAAVPFDGNPWVYTNQGLPNTAVFEKIKNVPIFVVHGSQDATVSPNWDNAYWSYLGGGAKNGSKAPNGKFWYFEVNMGHGTWNQYLPLPTGKPRWDWLFGPEANVQ